MPSRSSTTGRAQELACTSNISLDALWRIWLAISCIAVLSCHSDPSGGAYWRRILPCRASTASITLCAFSTAVEDPAGFYEFDPKIHAPEGSLLVWPWGYDYVIAKIVRGGAGRRAERSDPLHDHALDPGASPSSSRPDC